MNKKIKITLATLTVLTAAVIIVPTVISRFSDKEETKKVALGTLRSYKDSDNESNNSDGVSLGDYNVKIDHQVNLPDDAVATDVIEEDKDTGAVTVYNEDEDVEVINDKALEEAQKTDTEADEILGSALSDVIPQDNSDSSTKVEDQDTEVEKVQEVDQVKKDSTDKEDTKSTDTSDEVDQQTKDLFADLGWGEPATDHSESGIPEDAVWSQQVPSGKVKGGFTTP